MTNRAPRAVFFDVDFTLIYPGPTFDGEGYRAFAERYGMVAEPSRFTEAVRLASAELDRLQDDVYRPEPFVRYAKRVLLGMGATGDGLEACAREVYDEWAACHHFALYDDVKPAFTDLHQAGYRIGLISNTHRCLDAFQEHFELASFISAAVSSSDHGFLKPHPSIFRAALDRLGVAAEHGVMVGDSMTHDVAGAQRVGMPAVHLIRSADDTTPRDDDVPMIRSLTELPALLAGWPGERTTS